MFLEVKMTGFNSCFNSVSSDQGQSENTKVILEKREISDYVDEHIPTS